MDSAPFQWAMQQWNIAELALAQFALTPDSTLLDEAEAHVRAARTVFVDGSDYQTSRSDDLLTQVSTARGEA